MSENTQQPTNVIDFRSGKTLMPKSIKAALLAQYLHSKTLDHTPEMFLQQLEAKVLLDLAMEAKSIVTNLIKR